MSEQLADIKLSNSTGIYAGSIGRRSSRSGGITPDLSSFLLHSTRLMWPDEVGL